MDDRWGCGFGFILVFVCFFPFGVVRLLFWDYGLEFGELVRCLGCLERVVLKWVVEAVVRMKCRLNVLMKYRLQAVNSWKVCLVDWLWVVSGGDVLMV